MVLPPGLPSSSLQSPLHSDEKREHICFGKNVFSGKRLPLNTNSAPKFIRSHPSVGQSKGREHRGTSVAAALLALRGMTASRQVLIAAVVTCQCGCCKCCRCCRCGVMNGLFLHVGLFPTDGFQLENNKPPVPTEQFAYKRAAASLLKVPSGTPSQRHVRTPDVHKSHNK